MKDFFDLSGRVALVTGCSGGLGVQMAVIRACNFRRTKKENCLQLLIVDRSRLVER